MKSNVAFVADFERSRAAVLRVEKMLRERGECVEALPMKLRPDESVRHEWRDEGDIHVKRRIEVKHRKVDFTDDFPFDTIIVDQCYNVERGYPPLEGYYVVNAALTHYIYITASTRKFWFRKSRFIPEQNRVCECFEVPKELGIWGVF